MKIQFDGFRYLAFQDYDHSKKWIPFWPDSQGKISLFMKEKFGDIIPNEVYDVNNHRIYFQNCGGPKTCSGRWPNPDCGHCGGIGVGATFSEY